MKVYLGIALIGSLALAGCGGGGSGSGASGGHISIAPAITSAPPTQAGVGVLYEYAPVATGRPAPVLTVTGVPSWLSFQNGVLSGTPRPADLGTSPPITIRASNGVSPAAVQTFTIDVLAVLGPPAAPQITSAPLAAATEGTAYSYTVVATGNPPPALSASGLPGWLAFDAAAGTLAGTPGAADVGTVGPITITAQNGISPDATQTFSIAVAAAPRAPQFTSAPAASAREGQLYTYAATASGSPAPVIAASGLPAWLSFDTATATLAGTPRAADVGTSPTVTLTASNGVSPDATQQFAIAVVSASALAPRILSTPPIAASEGDVYAYAVSVTGTPTIVFTASGLPSWLTFDAATGTFFGTPAAQHVGTTSTITVTASNGIPPDAVQTFDLTVDPVPLVRFDFAGAFGNEASWNASVVHPNVQAPVVIRRGPGVEAINSNNSFNARGWTTGAAPDPDDYFTITIAPAAGFAATLERIRLDERRSSSGIRKWVVRSSVDGFATDLGTFAVPDDDFRRLDQTVALPASFAQLRGAIELRIYGYESESAFGTWRLDSIRVIGAVVSTTASGEAAAITSAPPTAAQEGQPYSYTIAASGNPAPTITVAGLPSWLGYDAATRTISGTPGAANVGRTDQITITASNGISPSAVQAFTIHVQGLAAPSFRRLPATTATAGFVYAAPLEVAGNPAPTVTVSGLPGWLSFDAATSTFAGVPGAGDVGTTGPITIAAANGIQPDATHSYTINVRPSSTAAGLVVFDTSSAAGNETALEATLIAANLATPIELARGPGILAQNGAGAFNASGFTTLSALAPNEHYRFTVAPASGFQTTLTSLVFDHRRSSSGPREFAVRSSLDGFATDLATFSVQVATDQIDQTVALGAAFTGLTGPVEFRLYGFDADSPGGTWRIWNIRLRGSVASTSGQTAPQITSAAVTSATVGTPYSYAVTASGNPTPVLAARGLPASGWLTFDATSGILTGTPGVGDAGNTGTITITASNGILPNASQQFSIAVAPSGGGTPPAITSTPPATATVGALYTYTVATTGVPAPTLSASGLPASGWLSFDAQAGVLSGTPGAGDVGTTGAITIAAQNGVLPDAAQTFTIAVSAAAQGGTDVVVFDTTGKAGNEATITATATDPNVQGPVALARGPGLAANAGADSFNSSGWALGAAIGADDYLAFTVAPASKFTLTLASLVFDHDRSNTGPQSFEVRTSLDGFAAAIATFDVPTANPIADETVTFGPAFANLGGPVEVRLYGFRASGTGGTWRIKDLVVKGSTAPVIP